MNLGPQANDKVKRAYALDGYCILRTMVEIETIKDPKIIKLWLLSCLLTKLK